MDRQAYQIALHLSNKTKFEERKKHRLASLQVSSFVTFQPILEMRWICARRLSYTLRCKTRYDLP